MVKGSEGEDRAATYLQGRGLRLLERNWRCRHGEIDLVMQDGATLVFVEVRARSRSDYGGAGESITAAKQGRLLRAAQLYLAGSRGAPACRFDAVLIDGGKIDWVRNAFGE